ncbi:MAG: glycosyltransferase [Chitinophagales bacterium]|nr:glycosyltransferase [Chitinophagales bacterium]
MTKTAVVILNWNGKEWLRQFLPSVTQYSLSVAEVWVADNASTDGSVEWLKENYPSVRILCLEKNWGFAGGYNRALENQNTYYVLLNSDVEVTKDWIQPIIRYLDEHHLSAPCGQK